MKNIRILLEALRLSLSFCWRNAKADTIGKMLSDVLAMAINWALVQVVGYSLVAAAAARELRQPLLWGFLPPSLLRPIEVMALTLGAYMLVQRAGWYFRARWPRLLNIANWAEIRAHRATLDFGRVKSKEHDDAERAIRELRNGWNVRVNFAAELFGFVTAAASMLLYGVSLALLSWPYALVITLGCVPMVIHEFRWANRWWEHSQAMVPRRKVEAVLAAPFQGPQTFLQSMLFGQLPTLVAQLRRSEEEAFGIRNDLLRQAVRDEVKYHGVATLCLLLVLAHSMVQVGTGAMSFGVFTVAFAMARTFMLNAEQMVTQVGEQWNSARGVILVERGFFGLTPLVARENPAPYAAEGPPEVRFEKVSFAYPGKPDQLVLHNVSFTLPAGKKLAVVGESGGGKSSLAMLLEMVFDPSGGHITDNGRDLRTVSPTDWHRHLAALNQRTVILERQIGAEIASSRLDDPMDPEMRDQAAVRAHFMPVVENDPDGFECQIGTELGGRELSGGEDHRLALARVLYRNASLLVLDEPDARLDPHIAERVMEGIFALRDVSLMLITHHVRWAIRCDWIVVMHDGEIAEQGTHQDLLARDGRYASMLRKSESAQRQS